VTKSAEEGENRVEHLKRLSPSELRAYVDAVLAEIGAAEAVVDLAELAGSEETARRNR
jgi:hypothetical protein